MKASSVRLGIAAACAASLAYGITLAGPAAAAAPTPRTFDASSLADICAYYEANGIPGADAIADFEDDHDLTLVYGTPGDDDISTGSGDQMVIAFGGDDEIDTGSGNDYVCGGAGEDEIILGSGMDEAIGGSGEDDLSGGSGGDNLWGGSDDDAFSGGSGDDRIWDIDFSDESCSHSSGTDSPSAC
jgi:Ca2+-binding RTX toxin-like protein